MRIAAIGGGNTAMKKTEIRKWTTNDSGKLADRNFPSHRYRLTFSQDSLILLRL